MSPFQYFQRFPYPWVVALVLLALGWWLSGPDRPAAQRTYAEKPSRIAADGRLLLAARGTIFRLSDGQRLWQAPEYGESVLSTNGAFLVVRRSETLNIRIMSTTGQSLLRQVDLKSLSFGSMAINAAGTWIAISSGYTGPDALMIYDIETGIAHAVPHPPSTEFETPQFTMDDRYLLVFGRPLTYIIDTNSWQTIGTISQNLTITAAPNYVISRPTDRMFAVYTLTNGAPVERHRFPDPYDISSEFTLSPDGQYLAVMDYTFGIPVPLIGTNPEPAAVHIALVRVADGAVVQRFEGPKGYMSNPTFTPDGQQIMTIGPGDGITFWQVALRTPWNVGLRLLPALLGLLLLLEQVRRFIVRGMRRPT